MEGLGRAWGAIKANPRHYDSAKHCAYHTGWSRINAARTGGGGSIEPSGRTPPKKGAQLTGPPKSYRD